MSLHNDSTRTQKPWIPVGPIGYGYSKRYYKFIFNSSATPASPLLFLSGSSALRKQCPATSRHSSSFETVTDCCNPVIIPTALSICSTGEFVTTFRCRWFNTFEPRYRPVGSSYAFAKRKEWNPRLTFGGGCGALFVMSSELMVLFASLPLPCSRALISTVPALASSPSNFSLAI